MDWVEIDKTARGFMGARILLTAIELDIFDVLGHEGQSIATLSEKINTNARATELLLDALTAMGYLIKDKDVYRNSEITLRFLLPESSDFKGGGLRHLNNLWSSWSNLTNSVRTGRPCKRNRTRQSRRDFLLAMKQHAEGAAEAVVQHLDLTGVSRALDLGGGPGSFAVAFARHQPRLEAIIFDRPFAHSIAGKLIAENNLQDRVRFMAGDFTCDDIGSEYDLVYMSSIIHIYSEKDNLKLLSKVRDALRPNGRVVIRDFFLDETRTQPLRAALFSINMLVNTEGGRSYAANEVTNWLKALDFTKIRRMTVDHHSDLILGTRT